MAAALPSHILDCGPQDRSLAGRLLSQEFDVPLQVQVAPFDHESADTFVGSIVCEASGEPADANMPMWEVIGGVNHIPASIVARAGQALDSEKLPDRLATGSRVDELEIVGDRLRYRLREGSGPKEGWVSIRIKDKELMKKVEGNESADTALNSTSGDNPDRDISHQVVSALPLSTSEAMPSQSQRVVLETQVLEVFKAFFPSAAITMETPFADCGIDSKDLLSLSERLGQELRTAVEPLALFDYPSVRAISEWLGGGIAAGAPATSSQDAEGPRHDEKPVATPKAPR